MPDESEVALEPSVRMARAALVQNNLGGVDDVLVQNLLAG